jgi:beta-catenin-like protein 1
LDADIKALSILSEHPELYKEFAKLGCVGSLVGLLAHENTDIAIDAVEIVSELTDEDVEVKQEQWTSIVDAMVDSDLLDLLVSNFARFNEKNESDRSGVYHALSVLENLASQQTLAEKIGQDTTVLKWLLERIQKKESPVTQNKQYTAEVLAILLQSSSLNRTKLSSLDGVDILQILAAYRKRDPAKGTEEEEFVENVFDALTCIVDEPSGKTKFIEAEGMELALIMIREGQMSKSRALRLIDHSLSGSSGAESCEKLVGAAGLKVIFTLFMKKNLDASTTEHLLGIFSSLLRHLPANSSSRIRTLAKFVEKEYSKISKLVSLRRGFAERVGVVEDAIRDEQRGMSAEEREEIVDEWYGRRLDAGLFSLQTLDVVLAWLVAEDDGAARRIKELLGERDEDLGVLSGTITGMCYLHFFLVI